MIDRSYPHNIVFLDIDGVLLTYRPELLFETTHYGANEQVLDVFLRLLEESPIPTKIVLISTHVIKPDPFQWIPNDKLRLRFKKLLHAQMPSIEVIHIQQNRYHGIQSWLSTYGFDVNKVIIIEDSIKWFIDPTNTPLTSDVYLIPCHTYLGLTWAELRLLKILLKSTFSDTDKRFISDFLQMGYFSNIQEDLDEFWKTKVIPNFT